MRLGLLLHAHLPWVRHARPWSPTERWFHEAVWECYSPLVAWLERSEARVSLSLSPPLAAMLDDEVLAARSREHVVVLRQLNRRLAPHEELRHHYDERLRAAQECSAPLLQRIAQLHQVEHLTTSATHAFLPGLDAVGGACAQIEVGLALQRTPRRSQPAFWLPECGWSLGVDRQLALNDVSVTVLDAHGLSLARPGVRGHGLASPTGVLYLGRARDACLRVWSNEDGYPGHEDYREFFRDVGFDVEGHQLGPFDRGAMTGLKYHRVSRRGSHKDLYAPEHGLRQADRDARDFVRQLAARGESTLLAFDAELFGHWWHEGLTFLERMVAELDGAGIELVPLSELAGGQLPVAEPAPSTWGREGFGRDWVNPITASVWREVHRAQVELVDAVQRFADAGGDRGCALDHAIEATLQAQASDWIYMLTNHEQVSYAKGRLEEHLEQASRMLGIVRGNAASTADVEALRRPREVTRALASGQLRAAYSSTRAF